MVYTLVICKKCGKGVKLGDDRYDGKRSICQECYKVAFDTQREKAVEKAVKELSEGTSTKINSPKKPDKKKEPEPAAGKKYVPLSPDDLS